MADQEAAEAVWPPLDLPPAARAESMLPAEGSARGERKGRGDERKKKVRGILVHKI